MLSFQMSQRGGDICSNKMICMYSKAHCTSVESMTLLDTLGACVMTVLEALVVLSEPSPWTFKYTHSTCSACIILHTKRDIFL